MTSSRDSCLQDSRAHLITKVERAISLGRQSVSPLEVILGIADEKFSEKRSIPQMDRSEVRKIGLDLMLSEHDF